MKKLGKVAKLIGECLFALLIPLAYERWVTHQIGSGIRCANCGKSLREYPAKGPNQECP